MSNRQRVINSYISRKSVSWQEKVPTIFFSTRQLVKLRYGELTLSGMIFSFLESWCKKSLHGREKLKIKSGIICMATFSGHFRPPDAILQQRKNHHSVRASNDSFSYFWEKGERERERGKGGERRKGRERETLTNLYPCWYQLQVSLSSVLASLSDRFVNYSSFLLYQTILKAQPTTWYSRRQHTPQQIAGLTKA